jgi:hypothetical protein
MMLKYSVVSKNPFFERMMEALSDNIDVLGLKIKFLNSI